MFLVTRSAPEFRVFQHGRVLVAGLGRQKRRLSTNDTTRTPPTTTTHNKLPPTAGDNTGPSIGNVQHQQARQPYTSFLTVDDENEEASKRFFRVVETALSATNVRVAFTCRGDKISRLGSIELGSFCFDGIAEDYHHESPTAFQLTTSAAVGEKKVFLVDFTDRTTINRGGEGGHSDGVDGSHQLTERLAAVRALLESETVPKIMHDARMGGDALFHRYGIRLTNVHDTSCCHHVETDEYETPLNVILRHHGLEENQTRGKTFYVDHPRYWETRPLTDDMIEWGTTGLAKLLTLADLQAATLLSRGQYYDAIHKSTEFATSLARMELQYGIRCRVPAHQFIGDGGRNIRRLRQQTRTSIYQSNDTPRRWMVYYQTPEELDAVLKVMGY